MGQSSAAGALPPCGEHVGISPPSVRLWALRNVEQPLRRHKIATQVEGPAGRLLAVWDRSGIGPRGLRQGQHSSADHCPAGEPRLLVQVSLFARPWGRATPPKTVETKQPPARP